MTVNIYQIVALICIWTLLNARGYSCQDNTNVLREIQSGLHEIRRDNNDHLTKYDQLLRDNHRQRDLDRKEIEQTRNNMLQLFQSVEDLKREVRDLSGKVVELGEIRKEKYEQTEKILKNMERYSVKKLGDLTTKSDTVAKTSEKMLTLLNSGKLKSEGMADFDDNMQEKLRKTVMESVQINLQSFKNNQLNPEFETMKEVKQGIEDLKDTLFQIRPNCNDHSEEMKIILENNFKNLTTILENQVLRNVAVPNGNVAEPNENLAIPIVEANPNAEEVDPLNAFQPAIRAPSTTAEPIPCNKMSFVEEPRNCAELRSDGVSCDGVYAVVLHPEVGQRFVYCDMTTDGGGWTVITRRGGYGDTKSSFEKSWKTYKQGFGNIRKDFWFGNNNLNRLTSQEPNELRVKLGSFTGETLSLTYKDFQVGNSTDKFRLKIGDVREAGDHAHFGQSLKSHDGQPFSTFDENNSGNGVNCAQKYKSGWWFQSEQCFEAILTAPYFQEGEYREDKEGIIFQSWKKWQVLKAVEMMVRPANFEADMA